MGLDPKYKFRKNGNHQHAEAIAQQHLKDTEDTLGDLPAPKTEPPPTPAGMTLRQQKEAELQHWNNVFMTAKVNKQEHLEAVKALDQQMIEARAVYQYIEQDLKRLPEDPVPDKKD